MFEDLKKPGRKDRINLAQVAEAAGVSKMTASRVLRNGTGFSQATRDKVLQQVERLGYVQNRLAAAFSSDVASTFIGVSIPDLGNEVFAQVLEGIERKLGIFGYQTVLGVSLHDAATMEAWTETMLSWRPAGLIVTGRNHSPRVAAMLQSSGVPIVEIWDLNSSPLDMCVGLSHYDSGYDMGRHFIARGRRRIGYVGTTTDTANAAGSRLNGFRQAVADGGGADLQTHVLPDQPGFYPGFYGTEQLLSRCPALDSVYFQNDNMAAGGMMYCQSKGLRIPADLGIAGWGDLPIAAILPGRLTTSHVSPLQIGQIAADKLLATLADRPVETVTDTGFRLVPGNTL
jgi:LacI family transcriptional regulator, gluconate utilization system Gnt-I transcriptional repressor